MDFVAPSPNRLGPKHGSSGLKPLIVENWCREARYGTKVVYIVPFLTTTHQSRPHVPTRRPPYRDVGCFHIHSHHTHTSPRTHTAYTHTTYTHVRTTPKYTYTQYTHRHYPHTQISLSGLESSLPWVWGLEGPVRDWGGRRT